MEAELPKDWLQRQVDLILKQGKILNSALKRMDKLEKDAATKRS